MPPNGLHAPPGLHPTSGQIRPVTSSPAGGSLGMMTFLRRPSWRMPAIPTTHLAPMPYSAGFPINAPVRFPRQCAT